MGSGFNAFKIEFVNGFYVLNDLGELSYEFGNIQGVIMTASKPSQNEDEYFARLEIDKMKKMAKEVHNKQTEEERNKMKELHFMHCAKCGMELHELLYKGVMIDVSCVNSELIIPLVL